MADPDLSHAAARPDATTESSTASLRFYPVLHLMTGPPGLARNGGIWKRIKANMHEIFDPARLMVQALHFSSYQLSEKAWEEWFSPWYQSTRIVNELDTTFGLNRDMFMDSGGFQILHSDKVDISRWGLRVDREDILSLQLRFKPSRIASLDSPIPLNADGEMVRSATMFSIENAVWLAEEFEAQDSGPVPYLVVHGRSPSELRRYLSRLQDRLRSNWLRANFYGIALGSQVPLTASPSSVIANIREVLRWMNANCPSTIPVHIFGVGDGIVGRIRTEDSPSRMMSYDNSTYVQNAFRLRIYDPTAASYRNFDPSILPNCACPACLSLEQLGEPFIADLLSSPAYTPKFRGQERVNRSDILALVALHNLYHWSHRVTYLRTSGKNQNTQQAHAKASKAGMDYTFPLRQFKARGRNLLLLPCSKRRPYKKSPSHRKVLNHLREEGFEEGDAFDRITLSGLFGPVHWDNESDPTVMGYDFALGPMTSLAHKQSIRFRTATVLNVIGRKYRRAVAYLPTRPYEDAFGPVTRAFSVPSVDEMHRVCPLLC